MNNLQDSGTYPRQPQSTNGIPVTKFISIGSGASGTGSGNVLFIGSPTVQTNCSNVKVALSGALTANTLSTILNIQGSSGFLDISAISAADTTSRNLRLVVTLDGIPAFDSTITGVVQSDAGIVGVGFLTGAAVYSNLNPFPQRFLSSCLVQLSSSISETNKTNVYYSYRTT